MKSKKNKAEIPKAFRDALVELAENLVAYYKVEIPSWDQAEQKNLADYTPSDAEIENFPLQIQPTYLTLKWSLFCPATWFFSGQAMFNVVHNPLFLTYDYILQTLFPAPDLKNIREAIKKPPEKRHDEIIRGHQLAVTSFRDLFYLSEKYFEKLDKEIYGRQIFDQFSHPGKLSHGEHPLTSLAKSIHHANQNISNMVDITDGIYSSNEMNKDTVSRESFSVIFESIWHFIQKRTEETLSLKDYIPPELQPGPIKEVYYKCIDAIEEDDKKIMGLQKDAVAGVFKQLTREAHDRLVEKKIKATNINLPIYIRKNLKKEYASLNSEESLDEKKLQEFLQEKMRNAFRSVEYMQDGNVKIIDKEKFYQESNHWAPKKHIQEPEEQLRKIREHLTERQKKILNFLQEKYTNELEPTQQAVANQLNLDRKTVRKELGKIRSVATRLKK